MRVPGAVAGLHQGGKGRASPQTSPWLPFAGVAVGRQAERLEDLHRLGVEGAKGDLAVGQADDDLAGPRRGGGDAGQGPVLAQPDDVLMHRILRQHIGRGGQDRGADQGVGGLFVGRVGKVRLGQILQRGRGDQPVIGPVLPGLVAFGVDLDRRARLVRPRRSSEDVGAGFRDICERSFLPPAGRFSGR